MRLRLLGPVCWYDLIRSSRRGRHFLLRCLYAFGLVSLLLLMYGNRFSFFEPTTRPQELPIFGEEFFNSFMIVQVVLVMLLTPAYVAGAIAEEKERRTLEFLLATDLQGQEIVFSKLVSRLLNLLLFLLAGLPVLSLLQLFGGISPSLLWCGFAGTGMLILSIGCFSILVSVHAKRARDAISRAALAVLAYEIACLILIWILVVLQVSGAAAGAEPGTGDLVFGWMFSIFSAGSVILSLAQLISRSSLNGFMWDTSAEAILLRFTAFHGTLALLFLFFACWQVRAVFLRQTYSAPRSAAGAKVGGRRARRERPPIGERPMLWKERYIENAARLTFGGKIFFGLCILFVFIPLVLMGFSWYAAGGTADDVGIAVNFYVRGVGTTLALLFLLGIGTRAAAAVAGERDRQTLDSLLASPLHLREILGAKWLGSLLSGWRIFGLLSIVWLIAIFTTGIHPAGLLLVLLALGCYSAFMASLGIFISATAASASRAILWTVGLAIVIGGGHWFCCGFLTMSLGREENLAFFLLGLTPPWVIGSFAFGWTELNTAPTEWISRIIGFNLLGLGLTACAAGTLWYFANRRFALATYRSRPVQSAA